MAKKKVAKKVTKKKAVKKTAKKKVTKKAEQLVAKLAKCFEKAETDRERLERLMREDQSKLIEMYVAYYGSTPDADDLSDQELPYTFAQDISDDEVEEWLEDWSK